jgi:hypothetical protein
MDLRIASRIEGPRNHGVIAEEMVARADSPPREQVLLGFLPHSPAIAKRIRRY